MLAWLVTFAVQHSSIITRGGTRAELSFNSLRINAVEGSVAPPVVVFEVIRTGDISQAAAVSYVFSGLAADDNGAPVFAATADDFVGASFPADTINFSAGDPSRLIFFSLLRI